MKINLKNRYFALFLLSINFVLLLLHYFYWWEVPFFDFDKEFNLPTIWSSGLLLLSGFFWFSFTEIQKNDKIQGKIKKIYAYLGVGVFFYLAIDELFQLHEKIGDIVGGYLQKTSFNSFFDLNPVFAWLWIFLPVVIIFLSFVLYQGYNLLQRKTYYLLLAGVILYIGGAYGMEILGWLVWHNKLELNYWYLITCEEFLEMTGLAIITATLYYKRDKNLK